ncbi:MAG: hypothetical protein K8F91_13105, partial [Candidatus Obscuribacterales bacterium]|nr:hypothetical protein [Candidatus Obscuribacterales bacterium]
FKAVKELVGEFYPKAKIKIDKASMHIEFKTRPYDVPSTNTIEPGPNWGGILVDLNLKKGRYTGIHQVPKKFNEYSYYHVILMAPYSKERDCHLLTRVAYPFDRSAEFVKRLTSIVNGFEKYL